MGGDSPSRLLRKGSGVTVLPINVTGMRCLAVENNKALISLERNVGVTAAPETIEITFRLSRPGRVVKMVTVEVEI